MTFVRYKRFGKQEYAYEINAMWDAKKKKPYQKSKYLGVVIDKRKKLFEKKSPKPKSEKLILDFGDSYVLNDFLEKSGIINLIRRVFDNVSDFVLAMINYRLCYPSAMKYAQTWFEANYIKQLYKNINLNSQRISDFLKIIGEEEIQRTFFKEYISNFINTKQGVIIDATSLPNQIHIPLTEWGKSGEEIDKQIRFLLVVDKKLEVPLFFRYFSGSIVDVSTLKNTIAELEKFGIKQTFVYLDAGYFSEDNIKELYSEKIYFLTRLPSNRVLYKELINAETKDLERFSNRVIYGKRALFIKQKKIDLFGEDAYAHIVLDPQRRGRETNKLMLTADEEQEEDIEYLLKTRGIMIVISSFKIKKEEVVPAYYVRQTAEKMFGFSKDDLEIIPLRVHTEQALRGFLLIQFISLIVFVQLMNALGNKHTVEELLLTMRNLKCKVYDDEIIVSEVTKKQRILAEKLGILMPKRVGI